MIDLNIMKKIFTSLVIITLLFTSLNFVLAFNFESESGTLVSGYHMGYDVGSGGKTIEGTIALVIKIILSLLGVIFFVLLIYGGFLWMTSRGNEQEITRAKNIMKNSIIGLVIVIAAYAITSIVWEIALPKSTPVVSE